MNELLTIATLVFFLSSLLNVILSTLKTVLTVKGTKISATLINCLSYTVYAVIIKQMSTSSYPITILVIFLTNLIGVYFALWVMDKIRKDRLWKLSLIVSRDECKALQRDFENAGIGYNIYETKTKYGNDYGIDAFLKNKKSSTEAKNILKKYDSVKYNVVELNKTL